MDPERRKRYKKMEFDEPCPEVEMLGRSNGRFPCHIIRQIYQTTNDEEIKLKCRVVTTMVRKMSFKLNDLGINWYHLYDENKEDIEE